MNENSVTGSLAWAAANKGALSTSERLSFLLPVLRQGLGYTIGRLRLAMGLRRKAPLNIDPASFDLPRSTLAKRAEEEAQETLTPSILHHSYRTFLYGLALAEIDGIKVDREHLYVTSLLHDISLESPDPQCCFAVRGGQVMKAVAEKAGADAALADTLAEAITHHITPGVGMELGPLPLLLQGGAMVDLTGQRLWHLPKTYEASTRKRYPRLDVKDVLSDCWKKEARTFSAGRAAFIEKVIFFSLLVRCAPFKE